MNVMTTYERIAKKLAKFKRIKDIRRIYNGLMATTKPFAYHLIYDIAIRNWIWNHTGELLTVAEAEKKAMWVTIKQENFQGQAGPAQKEHDGRFHPS